MIRKEKFFGGGKEFNLSGNITVYWSDGRNLHLKGSSTYEVKLDAPKPHHQIGGPYWILVNKGSANQTIKNNFGVTQGTLLVDRLCKVYLINKQTATWRLVQWTIIWP